MPEVIANIQQGKYEDVLAAVQSPVITLTELIKNASDSCQNNEDPIIVKIDTTHRVITITDFGRGFSKDDLDHLGEAGYSSKMIGDNTQSPIGNPLAGSKGLGLLTAFFISNVLEIETYSEADRKSYFLEWKKGAQRYRYEEIESESVGTVITLKDVIPEKLQMILLPEEKVKLFMASLRFFTNDTNLPQIKLIIDGVEESFYPQETLDDYYSRNKGSSSGFIAKAIFKYTDNKITLSYEDNISHFYTFSDQVIDLSDMDSIEAFARAIKAPEKGVAPIKSICESDVFKPDYLPIRLPAFSGILYTWRHRKNDDLEQWPVGVRIYINNYSLYRYLDKENDWLNLSEVSQNVKATNYKLKNTYGFLDLTDYNENEGDLKISKERDDFVDSMAKRKFIHIMRDVIIGAFTRIDMAIKNPPVQSFSLRFSNPTVRLGDKFDLSAAIICSNIGLDDIDLEYDENQLSINEDLSISATKQGAYEVKLSYGEIMYTLVIHFKNIIPEFDLSKSSITVYKGNSFNLRDYIVAESCKDVTPESIEIVPAQKDTIIINNDIFDKSNVAGSHIVYFRYGEFQRTLDISVKEIERQPGAGAKSPRISTLFPNLNLLRNYSIKLSELVDAISSYYVQAPTLCMAAIRILLESSAKAFLKAMHDEEINDSFQSVVNRVLNLRDCHEKNQDYKKCFDVKGPDFMARFKEISDSYETRLSKDVKTNINTHIKQIELDMFVHNPDIIATAATVYRSMQIFSPLLNYIFDVLINVYAVITP